MVTSAPNSRARDSASSLTPRPATAPPRAGGVTATRPSASVISVIDSRWGLEGYHSRRATTRSATRRSATAFGWVPGAMSTPSVRFQRCAVS